MDVSQPNNRCARGGSPERTATIFSDFSAATTDTQPLTVDPAIAERMAQLLEETVAQGRFPYVGLLVHEGNIIAEAVNSIPLPKSRRDFPIKEAPDAHPELNLAIQAIRLAEERFPEQHDKQVEFLHKLQIYSSCEPCAMCCHALVGAQINQLIFSLSRAVAGQASGLDTPSLITTEEIYAGFKVPVRIVGGIEESRCLVPFRAAWDQVRALAC